MKATLRVDAGICGFHTRIRATSDDDQLVQFAIETGCEKIRALAEAVAGLGPLDAYQEISPAGPGRLLAAARGTLTGCCAGCAVPVGLFKAMQVAAGLALPKDIAIAIKKGDSDASQD